MFLNISNKRSLYSLGIFFCLLLGIMSGVFSGSGDSLWYRNLVKPSFNPPSWVFGPTWTILYIMLGVALGILWEHRKKYPLLLILFALQFALNIVWSPLFFLFHRIDLALYDLALLWIIVTIFLFHARVLRSVFLLFIPYACWISFALILNFNVYILN